jgi:hypothetical protein
MALAASHPRSPGSEPVASSPVAIEFEELELPFDEVSGPSGPSLPTCVVNQDPLGTFPGCPLCGGELRPEHAHFRCACGWRDSCCD